MLASCGLTIKDCIVSSFKTASLWKKNIQILKVELIQETSKLLAIVPNEIHLKKNVAKVVVNKTVIMRPITKKTRFQVMRNGTYSG